MEEGYENITVLDISSAALEKSKLRLGNKADKVKWIVSDITKFKSNTNFDVWHDRASFHFLTEKEEIEAYKEIVKGCAVKFLIIGTFSEKGPIKCSGLIIKQYNGNTLNKEFENDFELTEVRSLLENTPGITLQDNPATNTYPMPIYAKGKDDVFVGRIRRDGSQPNTLNLWIVSDNLRKGAATNTIQIAEHLINNKLV